MKRTVRKTAYKILIAALILVMVPVLCSCRTRLTNNTEVMQTTTDTDGTLTENYQMRRDELSMPVAEAPIIKGGGDDEYDYDEYYDEDADALSEFEPEDEPDDKDREEKDDKNKKKEGSGNQGSGIRRPSHGNNNNNHKKTVTLDPNGGTLGKQDTIQVVKGKTYEELAKIQNPTRKGYDFEGWYTDKEKGDLVTPTTPVTTDKPHTLYAHWKKQEKPKKEEIKVIVTFDPYAGDATFESGKDIETKEVVVGKKYGRLPVPEREEYEFTGWFTGKKDGDSITSKTPVEKSEPHTLYAHWEKKEEPEKKKYMVSFNANEGEFSSVGDSVEIEEGGTYPKLPSVTREGYTFEGWYTDPEGGDHVSAGDDFTGTEDMTLYAHWEEEDPSVTWGKRFDEKANALDAENAACIVDDGDKTEKALIESCKGSISEDEETAQFVVRFLKNFDDHFTKEESGKMIPDEDVTNLAQTLYDNYLEKHPDEDVTVMIVSADACKGSDNVRLWYKLMLLGILHGTEDWDELADAAIDLGVENPSTPYIYPSGD